MTSPIYDAVLFDLDGVLTSTAALHAAVLEADLRSGCSPSHGAARRSTPSATTSPTSTASCARTACATSCARAASDLPPLERVRLIAGRKQALVEQALAARRRRGLPRLRALGAAPARDRRAHRRRLLERQRRRRPAAPPASSDLFDAHRRRRRRRGGSASRGKPAPDGFLEAARRLGVTPRRARSWSRTRSRAWPPAAPATSGSSIGVARSAAPARPALGGRRRRRRRPRGADAADRAAWSIVRSDALDLATGRPSLESVFAVGNGYLGLRGAPEEGAPAHDPGVDPQRLPRDVADRLPRGRLRAGAHRARRSSTPPTARSSACSSTTSRSTSPPPGCAASSACSTCRPACCSREVEFETARGQRLLVRSTPARLARATATSPPCPTRSSALDARRADRDLLRARDPRSAARRPTTRGAARASPRRCSCRVERARGRARAPCCSLATRNSGLELACRDGAPRSSRRPQRRGERGGRRRPRRRAGRPRARRVSCSLSKYVAYHWAARRRRRPRRRASTARSTGRRSTATTTIEREHTRARRRVLGAQRRRDRRARPSSSEAVRFNLFQLMQATARAEGLGVAAKGVTGRGYEGHYFWDTEIYVVPFLMHTEPALGAGRCSSFRVRDARRGARRGRARSATAARCTRGGRSTARRPRPGTRPAPRSTTSTPTSRTPCATTRGSAGDLGFLLGEGAEVLVETARLWMELGFFSERRDGRFCINARDRPGRVHDGRRQQRLHEPDGQGEPRGRRARASSGCAARTRSPTRSWSLATGLTDDGDRRAGGARPTRMYLPRHEQLGIVLQDERLPRAQALGLRGDAATSTRCCCTSTRSSSTATR